MFIFKILLYLLIAIFLVAIVGFAWIAIYIVAKVWPQARKEDYLLSHGYFCEKGYWCKGDRSLAGDLVYRMSFSYLVDYIERAEEKDSKEKAL